MEMRVVRWVIAGLILSGFVFVLSGCATKKLYHGVEATNLTGLFFGMSRLDAEKITGNPKREFQCDSGSIVTYVYDRGYTGCVDEGLCKPEHEKYLQAAEIGLDYLTVGLATWALNKCISPCQQGHLELFFDLNNQLIGARELSTDRDVYCWTGDNDPWRGYPCTQIYNNRHPTTIPVILILEISQEDTPDRICDQFIK